MYYRDYSVSKFAKGGEISKSGQNQDERALNLLNKLKEEGKLKRYLDVRGNGKKVFDTIIPNKKEKGMYKRYESFSQTSIGTLQNEYLDETDVLHWLKKTMPKIEMAKGGLTSDISFTIRDENDNLVESYLSPNELIEWAKDYAKELNENVNITNTKEAIKYIEKYQKNTKYKYLEVYSMAKGGEMDKGGVLTKFNPMDLVGKSIVLEDMQYGVTGSGRIKEVDIIDKDNIKVTYSDAGSDRLITPKGFSKAELYKLTKVKRIPRNQNKSKIY